MGRPQSADQKFVRARGPQNWNPEVFDQTRCSRTFDCRIWPEWQRIGRAGSVREKSVRANDPTKMKKIKGAFSLNNLLVGTARPPDIVLDVFHVSQGIALYPPMAPKAGVLQDYVIRIMLQVPQLKLLTSRSYSAIVGTVRPPDASNAWLQGNRASWGLKNLKGGKDPHPQDFSLTKIRDGPTTTTTIFELISRGPPFIIFGVTPDDAPNAPSTQWNTEKPQRFFIWCAIKCRFGGASDAKLFWKIMVVVVFGPSLMKSKPSRSSLGTLFCGTSKKKEGKVLSRTAKTAKTIMKATPLKLNPSFSVILNFSLTKTTARVAKGQFHPY